MTPAEMAEWLERDAQGHERAKAMSGPYEASHPGDEDAARCRAIAGWIRDHAARERNAEIAMRAGERWDQWKKEEAGGPVAGDARLRVVVEDGRTAHYAEADIPANRLDYPADQLAALYLVPMLTAALAARSVHSQKP